jgi:hypothetical protein
MSRWDRIRDRAGVPVVLRDGVRLLAPEDEAGLSRTLAAIARAGLRAVLPELDGAERPQGNEATEVEISLDKMCRVLSVDPIDGLLRVQPGTPWLEVEAAAATVGLEACVMPCPGAKTGSSAPRAIDLLTRRCSILQAHPFSERAAWLRDLRLVTPDGLVVSSPYAPRRSTGPDLRMAQASLGSAWGFPSELTIMASPQAAREVGRWRTKTLGAGLAILQSLVRLGPEASFFAELLVDGGRAAKPKLHIEWRSNGLRQLPSFNDREEAPQPGAVAQSEAAIDGGPELFKARWSELDSAWQSRVTRALRGKSPLLRLRVANPSAQGVEVELFGLDEPDSVAKLLPTRNLAAAAQGVKLHEALLGIALTDAPDAGGAA